MFSRIMDKLHGRPVPKDYLADFEPVAPENLDPSIRASPLGQIVCGARGRVLDKWAHYLPIYERYFERFRGTPLRMLEIGVFAGGSLEMWREYFGKETVLYGIDINPKCADRANAPTQVRIGSQDDPDFLRSVVDEMGGLDLVLDDGSHVGRHQWSSFEVLFPLLSDGGLYVIEDTHTSYWPEWEGEYGQPRTAMGLVKQLIDDQHAWYHEHHQTTPAKDWVDAIHVHDSIMIIEKQRRSRPVRFTTASQSTSPSK